MSRDSNIKIVKGYFIELLTEKNFNTIDKYFAPEVTFNGKKLTSSQFANFLETFYLQPFPDLKPSIEHQISTEDTVVTRVFFHGTHKGEFQDIAPTNKRIKFLGITIDHIKNGKITEMWHEADIWGLIKQLSMV